MKGKKSFFIKAHKLRQESYGHNLSLQKKCQLNMSGKLGQINLCKKGKELIRLGGPSGHHLLHFEFLKDVANFL